MDHSSVIAKLQNEIILLRAALEEEREGRVKAIEDATAEVIQLAVEESEREKASLVTKCASLEKRCAKYEDEEARAARAEETTSSKEITVLRDENNSLRDALASAVQECKQLKLGMYTRVTGAPFPASFFAYPLGRCASVQVKDKCDDDDGDLHSTPSVSASSCL